MELNFPAMRGKMGHREFYVTMVKMSWVPKLFKFKDWAELPAELRAQRMLQKNRIPEITQYMLDNEDGYLFSSLTASYDGDVEFSAFQDKGDIGTLSVSMDVNFIINDGQHRRAAIEEALKENVTLADENISVVLFPMEGLDRMQQMFSDLNRTARKTSKSLDILYNHRDFPSQIALICAEKIPLFAKYTDKERISLPQRSPKLFTLGSLYDAANQLLGNVVESDFDEKADLALQYWTAVLENMQEWQRVWTGELKPSDVRKEYICSHAVVMWGLAGLGKTLIMTHTDWKERLRLLQEIDWRRTNKEWQGIAMSGVDVVNRRQSRMDTASYLKQKFDLDLTPSEERSLRGATNHRVSSNDVEKLLKRNEERDSEIENQWRQRGPRADLRELVRNGLLKDGETLRLRDYRGDPVGNGPEFEATIVENKLQQKATGRLDSMSSLARDLLLGQGHTAQQVAGPRHWFTEDGQSVDSVWREYLKGLKGDDLVL